jgi:hypothetical protein
MRPILLTPVPDSVDHSAPYAYQRRGYRIHWRRDAYVPTKKKAPPKQSQNHPLTSLKNLMSSKPNVRSQAPILLRPRPVRMRGRAICGRK